MCYGKSCYNPFLISFHIRNTCRRKATGTSGGWSESTSNVHRLGNSVRYFLIWLLLRALSGGRALGRFFWYAGKPILGRLSRLMKVLTLDLVLNGYFTVLKARKRVRALAQAGSHKILIWLNRYMYRLTISVIILFTIGNNIFSKPLSAEELRTSVVMNEIIGPDLSENIEIFEEGPVNEEASQQLVSYLEGETVTTDNAAQLSDEETPGADDSYAITDDEGAIIAPIITNTDVMPGDRRDKSETYVVQEGDTISGIAERFGVSSNTILWANNLAWYSTIRPGQQLSILPTSGVAHLIQSGETIAAIAKKYQVDADKIVSYNKLADASDIQKGDTLIVPGGVKPSTIAAVVPQSRNLPSVIKDIFVPSASPDEDSGATFLWPIRSQRITQYFGLRHTGLDISDKSGTPIFAAESGKVERSGWTSGYGYNVVINHGNGFKTLYAHASKLLVSVGDSVGRGQTIALVGSTGRSTGPHVHFEVIQNGRKTNPLNYTR